MRGFVSLISFSVHLSFVYGRATDFCELILYPATLLQVFMSSRNFPAEFLGSLRYPLKLKKLLFLPFQFVSLISFGCFIALAKTSGTLLNRYGMRGQPYLVPDFNGLAFSFSPFKWMLAMGFL